MQILLHLFLLLFSNIKYKNKSLVDTAYRIRVYTSTSTLWDFLLSMYNHISCALLIPKRFFLSLSFSSLLIQTFRFCSLLSKIVENTRVLFLLFAPIHWKKCIWYRFCSMIFNSVEIKVIFKVQGLQAIHLLKVTFVYL